MTYKGKDYYFIRDNLRAITGLVDSEGKAVVNYRYNSWGKTSWHHRQQWTGSW